MTRKLPLLIGAVFLAFAGAACEGPTGPVGQAGPEGPQGPPGVDALATCSDCHHSDATIVAIEQQFDVSPHGFGNFEIRGPDYAGGSCVACHTSQGFTAQFTDEDANWEHGVASMNCRTCHQVHTEFDGSDYALTTTDPVEFRLTGATVDIGDGDNVGSNLCASCHQGRSLASYPDYTAPVTQMFNISNTHYGIHYGTQANVFAAELPESIEFGVTTAGPFTPHDEIACIGCHMGRGIDGLDPRPTPGGELGHTWMPAEAVCATCHDADFNYGGVQDDVSEVLVELGNCLAAEGVIEFEHGAASIVAGSMTAGPVTGNVVNVHGGVEDLITYHPVAGDHPEPYVAAYLVLNALVQDGSWGVHQPRYAENLAVAALTQMAAQSASCEGAAL